MARWSWRVEERSGDAAALHAAWPGSSTDPDRRAVAVCRVDRPGRGPRLHPARRRWSTPSRAAAAGVSVARRRSGGGAVLVTPGTRCGSTSGSRPAIRCGTTTSARAFDWLGEAWVEALGRIGLAGLAAHRGGYVAVHPLVVAGLLRRRGHRRGGHRRRPQGGGAGPAPEPGRVPGSTAPAVLRWDPDRPGRPPGHPTPEREAAADGLEAAVGAADLAGGLGGRHRCVRPGRFVIDSLP